jgi:hypothetical protein
MGSVGLEISVFSRKNLTLIIGELEEMSLK